MAVKPSTTRTHPHMHAQVCRRLAAWLACLIDRMYWNEASNAQEHSLFLTFDDARNTPCEEETVETVLEAT